jgi:DNA-binding transcriptional ArsR family regulator
LRELVTFYLGLANARRLQVVEQLASSGPLGVRELAERLRLSQPLLSWHLRLLRRSGLVRTQRLGREVICSLDRARFMELTGVAVRLVGGEAPLEAPGGFERDASVGVGVSRGGEGVGV